MQELSPEELDEVMRAPQPKARKSKTIERTYRDWFYSIRTELGTCDNPDCLDPRSEPQIHVWMHPTGPNMCRHCWLAEWLVEEAA